MKYTQQQIDMALGIMSGRLGPEDLSCFDDAQKLHGDLVSAMKGGEGNPGDYAHRRKAEEILKHLLLQRREPKDRSDPKPGAEATLAYTVFVDGSDGDVYERYGTMTLGVDHAFANGALEVVIRRRVRSQGRVGKK